MSRAAFGNAVRTAAQVVASRAGVAVVKVALNGFEPHGNLPFAIDFRDLYATVLERRWDVTSSRTSGGRFTPLDLLKG